MTMDDTPTPDTPQAASGSRAWMDIRARHVADGRLDGDGVAALIAEMRRQNRHEHPEWVKGYDTAVTEYEPVITELEGQVQRARVIITDLITTLKEIHSVHYGQRSSVELVMRRELTMDAIDAAAVAMATAVNDTVDEPQGGP